MKILGVVFLILMLTSCNLDLGNIANENAYTYQFNNSGCDTGKHSFSSRSEMCNALKNDALNNSCAYAERMNKFLSDCSDMSW